MSGKQLDIFTYNNVTLTFVEIFREDHLGEYSFKEVGYRLNKENPLYVENNHNFSLIQLPRFLNKAKAWEIIKRLLVKGKRDTEIIDMINYIGDNNFLTTIFNEVNPSAMG